MLEPTSGRPCRTDEFYRQVVAGRLDLKQMDRAELCARTFNSNTIVQAVVIRVLRTVSQWPVELWIARSFLNGREVRAENVDLLDANDVSKRVKRSKKRVYQAARTGELRSIRVGGNIRFRPEDVDRWIEQLEQDT